jgi:hypothetical protein
MEDDMSLRKTNHRAVVMRLLKAICFTLVVCGCSAAVKGQSQSDVKVYLTPVDPKVISDVFGKRIAERFIAIQITVTNGNADYQYLVQDISLDFKDVYVGPPLPAGAVNRSVPPYTLSSLSLSLLRGVAEKGQGQDKRNKILRLFRAVGTIAGGLVGVVGFGPSFAEAVAVFNGPVINSYSEAFPDYTINQMNRLNDNAYEPNTLIPKQQAKVLVAFVPQALFLTSQQRKDFWNEPMVLFKEIDLRRTDAFVKGNFIANVNNLPPFVTAVQIDPGEMLNFQANQPVVKGYISGRFLSGTTVNLLPTRKGLSLALDGPPTDTRVNFIINSTKPVPPDTPLSFRITNNQGIQVEGASVAYMPVKATLTGAPAPATGAKGATVKVTLTGTGFIPDVTRVLTTSGTGVTISSVNVTGGTTLEVTLDIDAGASSGPHALAVDNGSGLSNAVTFTVP